MDDELKIGNPDNLNFLNDIILGMGDSDTAWLTYLQLNDKGILKKMLDNYILILQNHPLFKGKIRYNKFTNKVTKVAKVLDLYAGPWTDADTRAFRQWINQNFKVDASNDLLNEAVMRVAELNPYHPVVDWILSLEWDQKPRLGSWLLDYMGVVPTDEKYKTYVQDVGTLLLGAAVKRVFMPGCKYDYVVLLEGSQGTKKSQAIQVLAYNPEWYVSISIPKVADKDIYLVMQGKWIVEFPEMYSFYRSENEAIKQFITTQVDTFRAPYGRHAQDYPRQCVFIATSNQYEHHDDETGYRRFLPIRIENEPKVDELYQVIPQLYAEAYFYFKNGDFDVLYLEDSDSVEVALQEQELAMYDDIWADDIVRYLNGRTQITIKELMINALGFTEKKDQTKTNQMRVGKILRLLGFRKTVMRSQDGLTKIWIKK